MREIKFRAWDKENKRFVNLENGKNGLLYRFGELCVSSGYDGEDRPTFEDTDIRKYEIMQYTGLKDKNGKEIYEGDIVHVVGFDFERSVEVKYEAPRFKPFVEEDTENMHWEVVGNIYENPELLK